MKCPVNTDLDLKIAQCQGVELHYCPECRGVWLDRVELDKIGERPYASANTRQSTRPQSYQNDPHPRHYKEEHHDGHGYQQNGRYQRKSGTSELFE